MIRDRDTTYHTYLELLMATFEVYDRMLENGIRVDGFDPCEIYETCPIVDDPLQDVS